MRSLNSSSVSSLRATPTTTNRLGSSRRNASEYSAGKSFFCVRSPEAPKMTSAHGSGVRRSWSPSSSGFSCVVATLMRARIGARLGLLERADSVAAELVAQCGGDLRREVDLVTGREARKERRRDDRRRHVLVDRLVDRPASLAGVLDVRGDVLELRPVLIECRVQELEQPRADYGAVSPDPRDLFEVEVELGVIHDLEPLRVRLHQAVLDPVVNHLHEVAGAGSPHVRVAVLRGKRAEDWLEALHRLVLAADHQAVADFKPPDPARDTCVDEMDASF